MRQRGKRGKRLVKVGNYWRTASSVKNLNFKIINSQNESKVANLRKTANKLAQLAHRYLIPDPRPSSHKDFHKDFQWDEVCE